MASWGDVERIAMSLPGVSESPGYDSWRSWKVRGKNVVWERPLGAKDRSDLVALGHAVPDGVIVGVRVRDLDAKEARLVEHAGTCFTIPHFDRYAAVLVRLEEIHPDDLEELVTEAWRFQATKRAVADWDAAQGG
jgi:hypothetical protein